MGYRVVSVVIPVDRNENPEWVQSLVGSILMDQETNEVLVITQGDPLSFPLHVNERMRVRRQSDPRGKKASALNDGLSMSRSLYTFFVDGDVVLQGDEIPIAREMLEEEDVHFVSCGYGSRPPSFPIIVGMGGWFSACRTNTFRDLGGWVPSFTEDVATTIMIKKAGFQIKPLPFSVSLRRPVRESGLKFLSVLTSFGRRP